MAQMVKDPAGNLVTPAQMAAMASQGGGSPAHVVTPPQSQMSFDQVVAATGSVAKAMEVTGHVKNESGSWVKDPNAFNVNTLDVSKIPDFSAAIEYARAGGAPQEYIDALLDARQDKIDTQYGGVEPNMFGSNSKYSDLYTAAGPRNGLPGGLHTASGATPEQAAAQNAMINALAFENQFGEMYRNEPGMREAYQYAQAGEWDKAHALLNQLELQNRGQARDEQGNIVDKNSDAVFSWDSTEKSNAIREYNDALNRMFGYDELAWLGVKTNKPVGESESDIKNNVGGSGTNINQNGGGVNQNDGGSGSVSISSDWAALLNQWLQNAQAQQGNAIDFATNQAIAELQRNEQDAAAAYQEQRNQIAVDEAKAKDNQALYAEARGDKGGIGAAQYDAIMANAAKSRLSVNQAQTKLSTDTARQISDLRAQGAYEKADALLELSQQYLSQLISLQQWQMEYNLSYEQFKASLDQWQKEYEMAVSDITGTFNGAPTFAAQQYQKELELAQQNTLAEQGYVLLNGGVMPSANQLQAMGMTSAQAQDFIAAAKLAAQQENELAWAKLNAENAKEADTGMENATALFSATRNQSFDPEKFIENNAKKYGFSTADGLYELYETWLDENAELFGKSYDAIEAEIGMNRTDLGRMSTLQRYYEAGMLSEAQVKQISDKFGLAIVFE